MTDARNRVWRRSICFGLAVAVMLFFSGACSGAPDGKAVLESRCFRCHTVQKIVQHSKSEEEWQSTIDRMVSRGARLSAAERAALVEYLVQ
jgi:hypothetical protein